MYVVYRCATHKDRCVGMRLVCRFTAASALSTTATSNLLNAPTVRFQILLPACSVTVDPAASFPQLYRIQVSCWSPNKPTGKRDRAFYIRLAPLVQLVLTTRHPTLPTSLALAESAKGPSILSMDSANRSRSASRYWAGP